MQPFLRLAARAPRAPRQLPSLRYSAQPGRFVHSSYGNEQSGMEQGTHENNPKSHMEHPGPESPASKGTAGKGTANSKSSSSSSDTSESQSNSQPETTSQGGSPAIHRPESAKEKDNPEVRKHNEEMEQRSERTVNQLSEKDNKVDKRYWKGRSIPSQCSCRGLTVRAGDVGPKGEKELPENVGR